MKKHTLMLVLAAISLSAKTPNVPAFEKILKSDLQKAEKPQAGPGLQMPLPQLSKPLSLPQNESAALPNVIGTMSVQHLRVAWLQTKDNKIVRAGEGMKIGEGTIAKITPFGVQFGNGDFMPIATGQVTEADVVFTSRDSSSGQASSSGMERQ